MDVFPIAFLEEKNLLSEKRDTRLPGERNISTQLKWTWPFPATFLVWHTYVVVSRGKSGGKAWFRHRKPSSCHDTHLRLRLPPLFTGLSISESLSLSSASSDSSSLSSECRSFIIDLKGPEEGQHTTIKHTNSYTFSHAGHRGQLASAEHWPKGKKKKTKNLKPIIIYIYIIDKTNLVVSGM